MTFHSNVMQRRRVRQRPAEWECRCCADDACPCRDGLLCNYEDDAVTGTAGFPDRRLRVNPGYRLRCLDCGTSRP